MSLCAQLMKMICMYFHSPYCDKYNLPPSNALWSSVFPLTKEIFMSQWIVQKYNGYVGG